MRPHLDDKILTAWNGLMISAFAKGGAILGEPRYAEAARRAADFILGQPVRRRAAALCCAATAQREAAIPGFLDDYAFFTQGLLDLYEAQFDLRYLELAVRLTEKQMELFEDTEAGGFFSTAADDHRLVLRMKDDYDGAEPSGNSVAVLNLLRLAQMTDRDGFRESADRTLRGIRHPDPAGAGSDAADAGGLRVPAGEAEARSSWSDSAIRRRCRRCCGSCTRASCPNHMVLLVDSPEAQQALSAGIFRPSRPCGDWMAGRPRTFAKITPASCPYREPAKFAELIQ